MRALHVAEDRVESAVLDAVGPGPFRALLDLGTGTGRMLELLAPRADRAIGIDGSHAMLNLARQRIDRSGLRNVQLRQGDLYALPVERDGYDVVVVHQVLHYLDEPARSVREAARVLRPGGRLLVVDFAPHADESLRATHAHRRLGFARAEIDGFMRDAGLETLVGQDLAPGPGRGRQVHRVAVDGTGSPQPRRRPDPASSGRRMTVPDHGTSDIANFTSTLQDVA